MDIIFAMLYANVAAKELNRAERSLRYSKRCDA